MVGNVPQRAGAEVGRRASRGYRRCPAIEARLSREGSGARSTEHEQRDGPHDFDAGAIESLAQLLLKAFEIVVEVSEDALAVELLHDAARALAPSALLAPALLVIGTFLGETGQAIG